MATKPRQSGASGAQDAAQDAAPAPGCVFMYRRVDGTGDVERIEVDLASGSVDVMTAQGWAEEM